MNCKVGKVIEDSFLTSLYSRGHFSLYTVAHFIGGTYIVQGLRKEDGKDGAWDSGHRV